MSEWKQVQQPQPPTAERGKGGAAQERIDEAKTRTTNTQNTHGT